MCEALRVLLVSTAFVGGGLAVFYEVLGKMPLPSAFYFITGGLYVVLVILLVAVEGQLLRGQVVTAITFIAVLAVVYFVAWSPRKPFLRALKQVEVNMTASEVLQVMSGYQASGTPDEIWTFHHTVSDSRFNSDWGRVYFTDGRVTRTEFLPD